MRRLFRSDLLYIGYSLNYLNEWYVGSLRDGQFYEALENKNITFYTSKVRGAEWKKKYISGYCSISR